MTGDERTSYRVRLQDLLLWLLGRYEETRPDSPLAMHVASVEWLTRDARAGLSAAEEARLRQRSAAFAERVVPRAVAAALGVRHFGARAPARVAELHGTPADVLEAAAARGSAPYAQLAVAAGGGRELWDIACEEWIDLPGGVEHGRYVALDVAGDSMLPLIHAGDVLLVKVEKTAAPDTVVVARLADDGYVVKRVAAATRGRITLAPLNPAFPAVSVPRERVLGTLVGRWCAHQPPAEHAAM